MIGPAAEPRLATAGASGKGQPDWGETPVGFVVLAEGVDKEAVLAAANAKLGKTQRLSTLYAVDQLPRSAIGKVLKRELRNALDHRARGPT